MLKLALFLLGISVGIFVWVMCREPRTLWSGASLLWMLLCGAAAALFSLYEYGDRLAEHSLLMDLLVASLLLAMTLALALPALVTVTLFVEGLRLLRREGLRPKNLLTMGAAVLLYLYLAVWPVIGGLEKGALGTGVYLLVSLSALYLLGLLLVYLLSAALNLLHWKKARNADYIVVLGCGLMGDRVTPLLAARVDKGIELLQRNPGAVLILSGGQGPDEAVPEGEAMAGYARQQGVGEERLLVEGRSRSTEENLRFSRELMGKEAPKVIVVTTAYHVFRALFLARRQGLKCAGFGAKTKWYFTLNALIREFAGYLSLTWKRYALMGAVFLMLAFIAAAVM